VSVLLDTTKTAAKIASRVDMEHIKTTGVTKVALIVVVVKGTMHQSVVGAQEELAFRVHLVKSQECIDQDALEIIQERAFNVERVVLKSTEPIALDLILEHV